MLTSFAVSNYVKVGDPRQIDGIFIKSRKEFSRWIVSSGSSNMDFCVFTVSKGRLVEDTSIKSVDI